MLASSGNHDLDGPGANGEQVAGWLQPVADERVLVDGASRRRRRHPVHRLPVVGRLADPRRGRRASWPPLPSTGRPGGSGSTTRPRPARCCAATAGASSPTTTWPRWIEQYQPDVVICGHIHQAPWAKGGSWHARLGRTQVFNAGKQIGHVPPHITFDTDAGTAHWFGVFDSETIELT